MWKSVCCGLTLVAIILAGAPLAADEIPLSQGGELNVASARYQCADGACSGELLAADGVVVGSVELSRCDAGDRCRETRLAVGDSVLTLTRSSFASSFESAGREPLGLDIVRLDLAVCRDDDGCAELATLEVCGGGDCVTQHLVDRRQVAGDERIEELGRVGSSFPAIALALEATAELDPLLGGSTLALRDMVTDFLNCTKGCVDSCGGWHNDGDCDDFQWSALGSTGVAICVYGCNITCGIKYPIGLSLCTIAQVDF